MRWQGAEEQSALRDENSPLTVAFEDPILRSAGLTSCYQIKIGSQTKAPALVSAPGLGKVKGIRTGPKEPALYE